MAAYGSAYGPDYGHRLPPPQPYVHPAAPPAFVDTHRDPFLPPSDAAAPHGKRYRDLPPPAKPPHKRIRGKGVLGDRHPAWDNGHPAWDIDAAAAAADDNDADDAGTS